MILSDLDDRLQHPTIHIEDDGLQFITLRQEPLENPLNRIMKRLLDIAVALPITVSILPIVGTVVWLCHRLQSPGPLFYRQARAGIQNRQFDIVKFRTMHVGNPDVTRQATNGDPRIFPAGRWLRKLSLDELPQFLNVLRGEMSVVGPRPHLIEHNDQFARVLANYHIRAFVRPGITGLAQVRGFRGEATTTDAIAARLEADTLYLENWSLFLDLGLILRTAWQMLLPPKSAY
jgi:putative colanic acid biosynthesis UDP-glucose lipid carrier transferase